VTTSVSDGDVESDPRSQTDLRSYLKNKEMSQESCVNTGAPPLTSPIGVSGQRGDRGSGNPSPSGLLVVRQHSKGSHSNMI
jgi:hypothetical protein